MSPLNFIVTVRYIVWISLDRWHYTELYLQVILYIILILSFRLLLLQV